MLPSMTTKGLFGLLLSEGNDGDYLVLPLARSSATVEANQDGLLRVAGQSGDDAVLWSFIGGSCAAAPLVG